MSKPNNYGPVASEARLLPKFIAWSSLIFGCVFAPLPAQAIEIQSDDVKTVIKGGASFGLGYRTSDRDLTLMNGLNAGTIGLANANRTGRNADDGELNYGKGDAFTRVVKGFADVSVTKSNLAVFLRLQAWHDFGLEDDSVPWGNTPSGFKANSPLSDSGIRARGKFSNIVASKAYVEGRFNPGSVPLKLDLGYLNIDWGTPGSALAGLDPANMPARFRPAAFAEEGKVPIPMIKLRVDPADNLSLEGFYQFKFVANQDPVCGTFQSTLDRTRDSCNIGFSNNSTNPANLSDQAALPLGTAYYAVATVQEPSGSGGMGMLTRWTPGFAKMEITAALARYDSRRFYPVWYRGTVTDTLVANGLARNPHAEAFYVKDLNLLALSAKGDVGQTTLFADYALRTNTPLGFPGADLFAVFTTANPANFLTARRNATARGAPFEGFDRYRTSDLNLGLTQNFKDALGASTVNLRAEWLGRFVHGLADPNILRYGRPEIFGVMQFPTSAACTAANPTLSCTTDGFTSATAWGLQFRAQALYPKVFGLLDLRPSATYRQDIKGWAYDQTINQGTRALNLSLDAIVEGITFNVTSQSYWGGTYQQIRDRDYVTLSVSKRF